MSKPNRALRLVLAALLCCCALAGAATAKSTPALGGFDAFVARELANWKVPGVAVAVTRDGQVILSNGYGWRDLENRTPVTSKTLFAIGSATKSFTVATLGVLVRQGKLDWDRPVREYLPDFRLSDELATERMTPRDLVTHRSGLPRHDAVWYNAPLSRKEICERLRYLEFSKDFRSTFQYQNLMFMTAGYLAGWIAGTSWEDCTRRSIFEPLGMSSTNFSVAESQRSNDFALPYEKDENNEVKRSEFRNIDEMGPAGSINSNAEDMIQYVLMHLSQGKHGDVQVLQETDVRDMQTPQMVIPGVLRWAEVGHTQYGMGFFVTTYRGHKLVHHGGNIDGFSALVSFMPQDNIGLVILTNMNGSALPTILSYNIYDRLLGLDPVAWSARLKEREAKDKQAEDAAKNQGLTPRKPNTKPSHDLADFCGEYEHPAYGTIQIEPAGEELRIRWHGFTSPLRHFHYDVFETPADKLNRLERTKVQFHTTLSGDVGSLTMPLEPLVKDIAFARVPERGMRDRDFLAAFAGQYDLGSVTVSVAMRDDGALVLTVPGQTPYELIPVRGTTFDLKGLSGYSVEFRKDGDGKVTQLAFYQPDGNYVATRK